MRFWEKFKIQRPTLVEHSGFEEAFSRGLWSLEFIWGLKVGIWDFPYAFQLYAVDMKTYWRITCGTEGPLPVVAWLRA